jgi:hypothetical protein
MLLNIYGTDWWMEFKYKERTVDVDFHKNDLGFCTGVMCGAVVKIGRTLRATIIFASLIEK